MVERLEGKPLALGSQGSRVILLQEILYSLGYDSEDEVGVFDEGTRRAVLDFQYDFDLVVDGLVGPQTMMALHLAYEESEVEEYDDAEDVDESDDDDLDDDWPPRMPRPRAR